MKKKTTAISSPPVSPATINSKQPNNLTRTDARDIGSLLASLREVIQTARQQALRAVDMVQVRTCWTIGRYIVEFEQGGAARAVYGRRLLADLAESLTAEFGKGFDASNLRYMRLFYQAFPNCDALRHELSWTHYRSLLRIDEPDARIWYMNEAADQNWGTRALDRQIGTLYYERLLVSQDRKSLREEASANLTTLKVTPREFVRDPVMLEFLGIPNTGKLLESRLEDALDLKTTELAHQDIGQMDMYVRMYDDLRRSPEDNPTVGIILCAQKDKSIVRYSVLHGNEQLFATKYKLVLPSEEELRAELVREQRLIAEKMIDTDDDVEGGQA